jgi:hypothetical protein
MQIKNALQWLLFTVLPLSSIAQNTFNPISQNDIGLITPNTSPFSQSFGGVSLGVKDSNVINTNNPAGIAHIRSIIFEAGGYGAWGNIETKNNSTPYRTGTLNHIALAIPLNSKYKVSLGYQPFSNIGYLMVDSIIDANYGGLKNSYQGSGGINKLSAQLAYKFNNNLSVGLGGSLLFGNSTQRAITSFSNSTYLNSLYEKQYNFKGFNATLGLQYAFKINTPDKEIKQGDSVITRKHFWGKFLNINLGGAFTSSSSLTISEQYLYTNQRLLSSSSYVVDTISYTTYPKYTYTLPNTLGIGMLINSENNKLQLGADLKYSNQNQYLSLSDVHNPIVLSLQAPPSRTTTSYNIGFQYIPNINSKKTLNKTSYKIGYFSTDVKSGTNASYKETGLTAGLSIPYFRPRGTTKSVLPISYFHVGVTYGKLQQTFGTKRTTHTYN